MYQVIPGDCLDCIPNRSKPVDLTEVFKKRHIDRARMSVRQFTKRHSVYWKKPKLPIWVGFRYVNKISQKKIKKENNKQQFPIEFYTFCNCHLTVFFRPYKDSGHRLLGFNPPMSLASCVISSNSHILYLPPIFMYKIFFKNN